MKKVLLISLALFSTMCNIYSQFSEHKRYTLDTILYMKELHVGRRVNDDLNYNVNDSEYVCLYKIKKKLYLETYNFKTGKLTKETITNREVCRLNINYHFTFARNGDTVMLIGDTMLLGYSLSSRQIFQKKKINSIEYSQLTSRFMYYGRFYNHSSNIAPTCIYAYNIHTAKLDSVILKHDFIEYTHYLPARLIAFGKDEIIYPDFGSYKVYILNKDLKTLDSVVRDIPDWISPSRELNLSIAKNPRDIHLYFPLLDKECFEHIDRIEYLEFLDSNQFLVRWYRYDTTLQQRKRIIDIWTKKAQTYSLSASYFETIYPLQMDSAMSVYGIPLRSDEDYTHYTKDYIVQLKSDVTLDPRLCKTYREYLTEREKQGKTNEPVVSFWIFKKL